MLRSLIRARIGYAKELQPKGKPILSDCWSMGVSTVNAEAVPLEWKSPATKNLYSVFLVSATDGWAVGNVGNIIYWHACN